MSDPQREAALRRARGLLGLLRGGASGEQAASASLLRKLLETHDLTLADLEPGLPATRDVSVARAARASDAWLARLGTPEEQAALSFLVDATDLDEQEKRRVLARLSLEALTTLRAEGWLHQMADEAVSVEHVRTAGRDVDENDVATSASSIAGATRELVVGRARLLARTVRRLRARDALHAAFMARVCERVSRLNVRVVQVEQSFVVEAPLSGEELGRVRAIAHDGEALLAQTLRTAAINAADEAVRRSVDG